MSKAARATRSASHSSTMGRTREASWRLPTVARFPMPWVCTKSISRSRGFSIPEPSNVSNSRAVCESSCFTMSA